MRLEEVGTHSLREGVDMRRFAVGLGSRPPVAAELSMGLAQGRSPPTAVSEQHSKTFQI